MRTLDDVVPGVQGDGLSPDDVNVVTVSTKPVGDLNPWLYGHFSEHLHRVVYGGMWSEMLEHRKFEMPGVHSRLENVPQGWREIPATGFNLSRCDAPEAYRQGRNTHHAVTLGFDAERPAGEGGMLHSGLDLDEGCEYVARVGLWRTPGVDSLQLSLRSADGEVLSEATIDITAVVLPHAPALEIHDFPVSTLLGLFMAKGLPSTHFEVRLTSPVTTSEGAFAVTADSAAGGRVLLDYVSLMPADNIDGHHRGVIDAYRECDPQMVKYPGGCFADNYDWRLGIGPRDDRLGAVDYAWGTWDENDFGTDEFMRWCDLTGATPYLCVNQGSGTPEMAAEWVEYCNGPVDSRWGAVRAVNGHPEPYGVKIWAIGNEVYGPWERGHMDPPTYAANVRRFAEAMKAVDPTIKLAAQVDLEKWGLEVVRLTAGVVDYLSIHHYSAQGLDASGVARYLDRAAEFEDKLRPIVEMIEATPGAEHVRLALDEWGWDVGGMAGAAFTARVLHACSRLAPYVAIGGHCCVVNPGGPVRRVGQRVDLPPTYRVFQLFNTANRASVSDVAIEGTAVDAVAYCDQRGASVTLVNLKEAETSVRVDGMGDTACRLSVIEPDGTDHAAIREREISPGEVFSLPPLSVAALTQLPEARA